MVPRLWIPLVFVCHEDLSKYANILKVVYLRPFGVNRWYRMLLPLELCFLVLLRCFKYVFPWLDDDPSLFFRIRLARAAQSSSKLVCPSHPLISRNYLHIFWGGAFFGSNMPRYPTHKLTVVSHWYVKMHLTCKTTRTKNNRMETMKHHSGPWQYKTTANIYIYVCVCVPSRNATQRHATHAQRATPARTHACRVERWQRNDDENKMGAS